jgi:hypothetical protein
MDPLAVSPSLALAAYAESWITGARVIVLGNALSPLAERLLERGARLVQVCDVDPGRIAEASARGSSAQISHALLAQAGTTGRDGAFDFGIVEDLSLFGTESARALEALSRALSRRGVALIASPNVDVRERLIDHEPPAGGSLGYYELYDAVSAHFEEVRMLGQTAFVGYAVADFGEGDAGDVRLDTAFLPGGAEEPEWFLALVSALPTAAESFAVIQLPFEDVSPARGTRQAAAAGRDAAARVAELEATLAELSARRTRSNDDDRARLQRLEGELKKREEWLKSLEARAATADQRADEAQSEIERLKSESSKRRDSLARRAESAEGDKQTLEKKLEAALGDKRRLEQKLETLAGDRQRIEQKLEALAGDRQRVEQKLAESERARKLLEDAAPTLHAELKAAREGRDRDRDKTRSLSEQERVLQTRISELTAALAESQRRLEAKPEPMPEAPATDEERGEVDALESRLREQAAEVVRLDEALHDAQRLGRQLIARTAELEGASTSAPTDDQVAEMMARNARLEADLEAARWTITSLAGTKAEAAESGASEATAAAGRRDAPDRGSSADPHPPVGSAD